MTKQSPPGPGTGRAYGSVVLREISDDDVPLALELSGDPYMPELPTRGQAREWIHRQRARYAEGVALCFVIADQGSGTAVGVTVLVLEHLSAGRASIGYSVAARYRGRGFATNAVNALTALAWTIPALHRVELYIEPSNTASIHVADVAGYHREGLLRSHQEIDGSRRDMLLYATIRPGLQPAAGAGASHP